MRPTNSGRQSLPRRLWRGAKRTVSVVLGILVIGLMAHAAIVFGWAVANAIGFGFFLGLGLAWWYTREYYLSRLKRESHPCPRCGSRRTGFSPVLLDESVYYLSCHDCGETASFRLE